MGIFQFNKTMIIFLLISLLLASSCLASRKLNQVYQPPPLTLAYNNGSLLQGNLPITILWYGHFTPPQKAIISDFLLSLDYPSPTTPSVFQWWNLIQTYLKKAGKKQTHILLSTQISDENCSLGKILTKTQITELVTKVNSKSGGLTLVLTSDDVAVERFCMSNCGFHGSINYTTKHDDHLAFIWVGNSVTQCPGQCAWPFHQPIYGPQTPPLGAPNGDVGVDGMVVNIAGLLASTVTNPFGHGYRVVGSGGAELEVASACTGVYGKGAYPGYAGGLLVDSITGASYNALGVHGRKFLLPALFDPLTSDCSPIV